MNEWKIEREGERKTPYWIEGDREKSHFYAGCGMPLCSLNGQTCIWIMYSFEFDQYFFVSFYFHVPFANYFDVISYSFVSVVVVVVVFAQVAASLYSSLWLELISKLRYRRIKKEWISFEQNILDIRITIFVWLFRHSICTNQHQPIIISNSKNRIITITYEMESKRIWPFKGLSLKSSLFTHNRSHTNFLNVAAAAAAVAAVVNRVDWACLILIQFMFVNKNSWSSRFDLCARELWEMFKDNKECARTSSALDNCVLSAVVILWWNYCTRCFLLCYFSSSASFSLLVSIECLQNE